MDRPSLEEDADSVEWEYEYSETETESFYAIIDLGPNAAYRSHRKACRSLRRAENANSPDAATSPTTSAQQEQLKVDSASRLQLLDLHTATPLLSYDSYFYRLEWNSPISSTLLYAHTPTPTLLTTMPARLIGIPSELVPKTMDRMRREDIMIPSTNEADTDGGTPGADSAGIVWENGRPVTIPLGPDVSVARRKQAKFLEQLMRAKRKKGEEDEVTVFATKRFVPWARGRDGKKTERHEGKKTTPADEEEDSDEMSMDEGAAGAVPDSGSTARAAAQPSEWPGVVPSPTVEGLGDRSSLPFIQGTKSSRATSRATSRARSRAAQVPRRATRGRPRGSKIGRGLPGLWGTPAADTDGGSKDASTFGK